MTFGHSMCPSRPIARRRIPTPRPSLRERHKLEIRNRLFRAAIELFATRGFTATTVEDITRAAEVAKGTFFNYFPTKEMLLTELEEFRLDIMRAALNQARQTRLPLRNVLRQLLVTLMEEPGRSRARARCMLLSALGTEQVARMVEGIITRGRQYLTETIAIGQRRGEIRRDWPASELARQFQQAFFGVLHLWTLHPHLDLPKCLDATFALYWAGVEPRPPLLKKRRS
jgi:AcrR family transcriptional regulator